MEGPVRNKRRSVDSLERIDTLEDWKLLHVRPGHHTVARTETVKFLIDLHDDDRTYFFDSKKWETHFGFVRRFIDPCVEFQRFNISEYTREDRRFVLGSLMHYLDGDHWTIELLGGDTLSAARIGWMFECISARLPFAARLKFRPLSPLQIENATRLGDRVPVLSSDALNASVSYQPVVLGVAYGHLRLVRGTLDVSGVRPYDIVVSEYVPDQIPPVAGLVTSQLQAPLAHVAVLSRNRNTPDMALRGAIDLDAFKRFEGKLVKLTVSSQDYSIELADPAQAESAWTAMRPAAAMRPECDPQVVGLFNVAELAPDAVRYVGAKAAQMGRLCHIEGIATAGGFAIPFSAYLAHLESAGLTPAIDAMLSEREFGSDAGVRALRLAEVRKAIAAHPVQADLLAALCAKLRGLATRRRFIFRSSTNAEDLDGFNGAGLYESIAVAADPTAEQVADALREVWASVWLQRAFEEREWYRIEHRAVAMGVLVQPFVEDAVATGVAITGNPFKPDLEAVFINTQLSGSTVTSAQGNELPEQYLVVTWGGLIDPELLSRSSLAGGAPIMREADITDLTTQLQRIHRTLLVPGTGTANAMDVEFALTHDRRIVMLQARPYTIVYSLDRSKGDWPKTGWLERLMRPLRKAVHRLGLYGRARRRPA
jgi:Pyruvate phosphate dikinase, AMP/ATP-binding domain